MASESEYSASVRAIQDLRLQGIRQSRISEPSKTTSTGYWKQACCQNSQTDIGGAERIHSGQNSILTSSDSNRSDFRLSYPSNTEKSGGCFLHPFLKPQTAKIPHFLFYIRYISNQKNIKRIESAQLQPCCQICLKKRKSEGRFGVENCASFDLHF